MKLGSEKQFHKSQATIPLPSILILIISLAGTLFGQTSERDFVYRKEMVITKDTPLEEIVEHYAKPYDGPLSRFRDVDPNTLTGKVMAGYQGWHRAEGDNSGYDWDMWAKRNLGEGDCAVDMWPDMSEFHDDEKYPTPFKHANGETAYLYSAYNRKTVFRHFSWMKDYGIDGAFPQRFSGYLLNPENKMGFRNYSRLGVLSHVRDAANFYGRTYAVMYDVHFGEEDWKKILYDWSILKNKMKLTEDPYYLKHDGKPILALWGFYHPDRNLDIEATRKAIELLKTDPRYGPVTVLLGVNFRWNSKNYKGDGPHKGTWDKELYKLADIILPWKVAERDKADLLDSRERWTDDLNWCEANNIEYFPVVSPGFSWRNKEIERAPNSESAVTEFAPRRNGELLAEKITITKKLGAKQVYVAMFDEVDEGTAIYKVTTDPPVSENHIFVPYRVPSDHYLKMAGDAGRLFKGEIELDEFRKEYVKENFFGIHDK